MTSTRRKPTRSKRSGADSALSRLPLDIIECPDRRLGRAAIELVADATLDGDTECTVLLPRRGYARVWQHFLHDRTADKIAAVLSQVPHVSATIIPYNLPGPLFRKGPLLRRVGATGQPGQPLGRGHRTTKEATELDTEGRSGVDRGGRRDGPRRPKSISQADQELAKRAGVTTPIVEVQPRHRVKVAGRVKSVRVQPRAGTSNLECVLSDGTAGLLLVFQGRPKNCGY